MTYINSWEEFEKAAEVLYLQDPMKVRYTMKYHHNKGRLLLKLTNDVVCLQYKTEIIQDLKRIEKFINNLMRHMASKEHFRGELVHDPNIQQLFHVFLELLAPKVYRENERDVMNVLNECPIKINVDCGLLHIAVKGANTYLGKMYCFIRRMQSASIDSIPFYFEGRRVTQH